MEELERSDSASKKAWGSSKAGGVFALIVGVFVLGWYFGIHQNATFAQTPTSTASSSGSSLNMLSLSAGSSGQPQNIDLSEFWRVWNLLNENFVNTHSSTTPPTDQEKVYGAIQGLVNSYGDAYTVFMPPEDAQSFGESISGSFEGVGMEIGSNSGQLVVVAPLKGSPAAAAGVLPGDKIISIDDKAASNLSVDEAVKLIRGPKDTTVKITFQRGSETEPRVISIKRDTIHVPSTNYSYNAGTGIFEIDLYSFSATSPNEFRDALRAFFESGSTKLLLDLRGNPGGYLDAAVDMASFFLPTGSTIVTEDYRGSQNNVTHRSFGYNVFANKKLTMAIIMDQGTASAAEILAGALQQHGVAKLVGTRSFGKGSVQELFDVGGGAEVKITVARWLTPNGTSISDGGLTPDINATTTVEDLSAGRDPQKSAATMYLTTH